MSVERVVINSSGGSPLRVSASGVDANLAQFEDLLFDGNQAPLRLHQVGYVTIMSIAPSNIAPAVVSGVPITALPGYPSFSVMVRQDTNSGTGPLRCCWRNGADGAGGVVNPGQFYGVQWGRMASIPGGDPPQRPGYINFAIFKNYLP